MYSMEEFGEDTPERKDAKNKRTRRVDESGVIRCMYRGEGR